ncbi:hypothetical protein R3W88_014897 [Solanum pinnatisectum]|uniref:RNase H type-1 domain-containing protein n=1 Tax=Solanum pinnatisectum TaxID=50273 RepID=A0AAV9KSZ8_9SOLN|nr:hypothetical protein R3W88_014897 [Solanum pinnatisectum]
MSHLFLTASIAQKLWKYFASCAGIDIEDRNLMQTIKCWWYAEASNKLQIVMRAIPALIMWGLWKRRNQIKHERHTSFEGLVHQVEKNLQLMVRMKSTDIKVTGRSGLDIVKILGAHKPRIYHHIVQWKLPEARLLKCNTDGASKGNPGESAYGFCFRDSNGDLIHAQAKRIGFATDIEAEARAIHAALQFSKEEGWQDMEIETTKNIIQRIWRIPWEIAKMIDVIIREVQQQQVTIKHIYREGNQMADYLANVAMNQEGMHTFRPFTELPRIGKCIINNDKAQIPNIRIKTKQIKSHERSAVGI